ncbi:MAG: type 4a pilus biogenesis protein PilO [Candidatus Paceibacterota bacterium]
MMRIILPSFLFISALAVSFLLTQPLLTDPATADSTTGEITGGVMSLLDEKETLDIALADARALSERISELDDRLESIPANRIERLDAFLPDDIDEIQLIVDVNNIAARSGMRIADVKVGVDEARRDKEEAPVGPTIETLSLSFKTAGSYSQLKTFIGDLSRSLRVMDIKTISFTLNEEEAVNTYDIKLTTYWLK